MVVESVPANEKPLRRWFFSFLIVSGLHLAFGMGIYHWKPEVPLPEQTVAAIMVEYAPALTVSEAKKKDLPPGPEQEESLPPKPVMDTQLQPQPVPELPITEERTTDVNVTSKPKPPAPEPLVSTETSQTRASSTPVVQHATAPPPVEVPTGDRSAAPVKGVPTEVEPFDPSIWLSEVHEHLERHKKLLPHKPRLHRQQRIAQVRIIMDKKGRLLGKTLEKSTRSRTLDQEALELISLSQPFPPPPPEIPADIIEITLPIEFSIY